MSRKRPKKTKENKEIARERICVLFSQAKEEFGIDPALSDRYVFLARKIAMKMKVRLTSEQKRMFCRHCYGFLMPGKNCRVRMNNKTISYFCERCRKFSRIGYRAEKKSDLSGKSGKPVRLNTKAAMDRSAQAARMATSGRSAQTGKNRKT